MKRAGLLARAAVVLLASAHVAQAQEAIYVVRHAERADQSADSPLSTEGVGRARRLEETLRHAGITHVFTSDLRRTIDTAAPFAGASRLSPQRLRGADVLALVARLSALKPNERALVVGHSNTVPELLRALHVSSPVTIADNEYDNLFIVVPLKHAPPMLIRLRY